MERQKGQVREASELEMRGLTDDDRRGEERVAAQLEMDVPLSSWDEVRRVFTRNISKGGLLFTVSSPAMIAATMDLVVTLPDGKKITLQSEVRHVARTPGTTDFEVGVQFAGLDDESRQMFEEALGSLKS